MTRYFQLLNALALALLCSSALSVSLNSKSQIKTGGWGLNDWIQVKSGKVNLFDSLSRCNNSCKSPSKCQTVSDYPDLKSLLTGGRYFCLVKEVPLRSSNSNRKLAFKQFDVCNAYCQPIKQSLCISGTVCSSGGNNCSSNNKVQRWLC